MARTAQLTARGFSGRVRVWGDVLGGVKRRLFEGLGMLLVLASLLLLLALLTYNPGDASLNTAVAAPARNYLGHDGAVIADLLIQSIGLAVYLLPAVLLGWAFRLMLQRPIRRLGRKLGLLLLALLLGAVACSVLHPALALALPAGAGGAVAAAQFGQYLFRRWRGTRRAFDEPPAASSYQAVIKRGAGAAPRLAVVPDRREPRLGPVPAGAPPQLEAEPE